MTARPTWTAGQRVLLHYGHRECDTGIATIARITPTGHVVLDGVPGRCNARGRGTGVSDRWIEPLTAEAEARIVLRDLRLRVVEEARSSAAKLSADQCRRILAILDEEVTP